MEKGMWELWGLSPECRGYFLLLRGVARAQQVKCPCGLGAGDPWDRPVRWSGCESVQALPLGSGWGIYRSFFIGWLFVS